MIFYKMHLIIFFTLTLSPPHLAVLGEHRLEILSPGGGGQATDPQVSATAAAAAAGTATTSLGLVVCTEVVVTITYSILSLAPFTSAVRICI